MEYLFNYPEKNKIIFLNPSTILGLEEVNGVHLDIFPSGIKTKDKLGKYLGVVNMCAIDEKDLTILDLMKENAKLSMKKIAKKTGIPVATVHHRIKKLEKDGIIKKYTVLLNKEKLGRKMVAYILINVHYPPGKHIDQSALLHKIAKNDYVEDASILAGETDIILKVRVPSIPELNKLLLEDLRNMEGIGDTKTLIALENLEKI